MLNVRLLPRPWSCDEPRNADYQPTISGKALRVNKRRKLSWRAEVMVDGITMAHSHHDTKAAAEKCLERMIEAYAQVHYSSR